MTPVRLTIADTLGGFCDALRRAQEQRHWRKPFGFNPAVLWTDGRYYLLRNVATFEKTPHHGMTVEYPGQSWTAEDPDNAPLGPGVLFDVQPVGGRLDVVALCQHDAYLPAFARLLATIGELYPEAKTPTAAPEAAAPTPAAPDTGETVSPLTTTQPEAAAPQPTPEPDQEPEADTTPPPAAHRPLDLTQKEEEIADLYADGKTPEEIATMPGKTRSTHTIESHLQSIRSKLRHYLKKKPGAIPHGATPGLLRTLGYGPHT